MAKQKKLANNTNNKNNQPTLTRRVEPTNTIKTTK